MRSVVEGTYEGRRVWCADFGDGLLYPFPYRAQPLEAYKRGYGVLSPRTPQELGLEPFREGEEFNLIRVVYSWVTEEGE